MPLVNPKDEATVLPEPSPVQIVKPEYKGVTVDTKMTPLSSLLSHVEGSSWTVNYYSQVIDRDTGTSGQSVNTNPVHQQYRLIKQMELKVTSPLSMTQDPTSKTLTYSGTATVYPFVIPNEGDMFLADIGDGREGIFQIHTTTRMSVFTQTCHTIEYRMVDYSDPERRADFNRKVVQTLHYEKDFLMHGQNPLLFEEDYSVVQFLRKNYKFITDRYFKQFFGREYSTMLVPHQLTPTYDPYITEALLTNFTTWDSNEIRYVRKLNMDDDQVSKATNIWTALIQRDPNLLNMVFTQVGKVWAAEFSGEPMYEGIRFSGIKEVIYPNDPEVTVDFQYTTPPKLISGSEITIPTTSMRSVGGYLAQLRSKTLADVIDEKLNGFQSLSGINISRQAPLILPAMADGYYVLSRGFYENDQTVGSQSKLDLCVRQYLNNQQLSLSVLKEFCEAITTWNSLDQFYLTPIVLILIKSVIRST
jgi:hypothetical protein